METLPYLRPILKAGDGQERLGKGLIDVAHL